MIAMPSSGYLSRVESAEKTINDRLVKLICGAFSVNETYLRYGEGEMFTEIPGTSAGPNGRGSPPDEKFMNLVHNFKSLPPKYQEFLFKMFDMFLKMRDE
jgi:hypothetical protein